MFSYGNWGTTWAHKHTISNLSKFCWGTVLMTWGSYDRASLQKLTLFFIVFFFWLCCNLLHAEYTDLRCNYSGKKEKRSNRSAQIFLPIIIQSCTEHASDHTDTHKLIHPALPSFLPVVELGWPHLIMSRRQADCTPVLLFKSHNRLQNRL